jgi:hypothetical protein
MCVVTDMAREHERLNLISLDQDDQSFAYDETAQAMHACRILASHHVPETAEGWAFQAETLEIGHEETYGRLHRMLLDHFEALATLPAQPAAAQPATAWHGVMPATQESSSAARKGGRLRLTPLYSLTILGAASR